MLYKQSFCYQLGGIVSILNQWDGIKKKNIWIQKKNGKLWIRQNDLLFFAVESSIF